MNLGEIAYVVNVIRNNQAATRRLKKELSNPLASESRKQELRNAIKANEQLLKELEAEYPEYFI